MEAQVERFLKFLAVERGASSHTVAAYRNDLIWITANLDSWDPEGYRLLEVKLKEEFAASTARRRWAALRGFCRFRRGEGWSGHAPGALAQPREKRLPKSLRRARVERMVASASGASPKADRDLALLTLLSDAGLRVTEAVSLTLDGLDLERGRLRIIGKAGRERIVPLPLQAVESLSHYVTRSRPELHPKGTQLIVGDRGGPMARETAYRIVRALGRRVGALSSVGPHTLRHSYAVDLVERGVDLRAVQELLGHASLGTTQIYTELRQDVLRKGFRAAHPRG